MTFWRSETCKSFLVSFSNVYFTLEKWEQLSVCLCTKILIFCESFIYILMVNQKILLKAKN